MGRVSLLEEAASRRKREGRREVEEGVRSGEGIGNDDEGEREAMGGVGMRWKEKGEQ